MKRVQLIRDTTANLAAMTPLVGELFVDTTKDTVVVGDGVTAGGNALAREDLSNVAEATVSAAGKMSSSDKTKLNKYPNPVALAFLKANSAGDAFSNQTSSAVTVLIGAEISGSNNGSLFLSNDGTYKRNTVNAQVFGR